MADGYLNKCKTCTKIDVKTNYNKNFVKRRNYDIRSINVLYKLV